MNLQSNWIAYALASAFFAALTAIFGKLGVTGLNSDLATFIRTIVILGVCCLIISLRGEWQYPDTISTRSWLFLILSGIATGLSWLCYYRALQLGPVSKVAPIDKLSVALAILLAVIFLGEKLTWATALGAGLIVAGSVVLVLF
ncbi:EamA family transporter [Herminiimonas arsenitoxidans]|uniref:EamA family transporter n=1 Tax=Herminiimonas arsenitoxidans TaxID=1809410 RepID=UPI00097129FE|nr:EamA family transporter [Herminiimonas arsenitoxidans]